MSIVTPFVLEKLKLLGFMFLVVLYPPQWAHFSPIKWNLTVDCWKKKKKNNNNHAISFDYINFNSPWSNHCRKYLRYCSHEILELVNFELAYQDNPIILSYQSLMFDKLDTRNVPMPAAKNFSIFFFFF